MAAPKKKKVEKSSNPNIVLIIFVVFLFLVNIGLGVWVYYEHDTQRKLTDDREAAKKALNAEKVATTYQNLLAYELRMVLGDSLSEEEMGELELWRKDFNQDNFGKYKEFKSKEAMRKLIDDTKTRLGYADDGKNVKSDYPKELKVAEDRAKKLDGEKREAVSKQQFLEKYVADTKKKQDEFHQKIIARVNEGAEEATKIARQQTDGFVKLVESVRNLNKELKDKQDEFDAFKEDQEKIVRKIDAQVKRLEAERKELIAVGGGGGGIGVGAEPGAPRTSPLLLSISTGRPLWDLPVGKISRVDPESGQVVINVGSAQGAKRELTFLIFAGNGAGKAEKQLKGSIEIIRVVDANTSVARITSLFDLDGREIMLNDISRSKIVRESEAPIREGDLLFNMFWGSRVAIVGSVSITGEPSDNPAEQIRQMDDFIYLLKRNGMQVDAYVDLRDGKIQGQIDSKTRYLIIGDELTGGGNRPAPMPVMKEKEGDDKEMAKDPPPAKEQPGDDRARAVRDSGDVLRRMAAQKGLLAISADNFAIVTGYRRARSANNPDVSRFTPLLPSVGEGAGIVDAGRPLADPKKGPAEKKMDNPDN